MKPDPQLNWLLDAHGDRVFRLCLRLTGGCHAEAEDLAQETLLAALKALPRFGGRARMSTWLHAIAVNLWRKHQARREPAALRLEENDRPLPDGAAGRLLRLSLDEAITSLPDPLREAFVLVKAEGLTHREAARILSVPQGTVQTRVHEAVKRLRVFLADWNEEGNER